MVQMHSRQGSAARIREACDAAGFVARPCGLAGQKRTQWQITFWLLATCRSRAQPGAGMSAAPETTNLPGTTRGGKAAPGKARPLR